MEGEREREKGELERVGVRGIGDDRERETKKERRFGKKSAREKRKKRVRHG